MKKNRKLRRLLMIAFSILLLLSAAGSVFAEGEGENASNANAKVNDARKAVVNVIVQYMDDEGTPYPIQSGSAFFINNTTLITCNHVVTVTDETINGYKELDGYKQLFEGKDNKKIRERMRIGISTYRNQVREATVIEESRNNELDTVALKIESPLNGYTTLPLRASSEVMATEPCWALGFPDLTEYNKDVHTYTQDQVASVKGTVSGYSVISSENNLWSAVQYIVSDVKISNGNSGSPLVDDDGNVIGICQGGYSGFGVITAEVAYAISTDELMNSLDPIGVEYTPIEGATASADETDDASAASATPAVTEAPDGSASSASSASSTSSVSTSSSSASSIEGGEDGQNGGDLTSPDDMDTKSAGPLGLSWPVLIAIIAAIVAVIIILLVVFLGKKKKAPAGGMAPTPMGSIPTPPPIGGAPTDDGAPVIPQYSGGVNTSVLNQGSNETTVLGQGSNETTVLNQSQVYGVLVRKGTGERITINKENFKIGREKSRVDYCISDNTAVGRLHAVILSRGGSSYIVDQNSRNFTFVNDVRSNANVETKLSNGDKIALGDEEFTFELS